MSNSDDWWAMQIPSEGDPDSVRSVHSAELDFGLPSSCQMQSGEVVGNATPWAQGVVIYVGGTRLARSMRTIATCAFMSLDPLDSRAMFATQLSAAQVQQAVSWLRELRVEDFDWALPHRRLRPTTSFRVHAPPWNAPKIEDAEAEFVLAHIS